MDINCTLPCLHQANGKCVLVVVPDFVARSYLDFYEGATLDCAYFEPL